MEKKHPFLNLTEVPQTKFLDAYKQSNLISRFFYSYTLPTMNRVIETMKQSEKFAKVATEDEPNKKHFGFLKVGDILNIDLPRDIDSATRLDEAKFQVLMDSKVESYEKQG